MTEAPKTHNAKVALAAISSFIVNAGVLPGMTVAGKLYGNLSFGFACFSILAVPIVTFVLLLYFARVGQAAIAIGITVGLISGVSVGFVLSGFMNASSNFS